MNNKSIIFPTRYNLKEQQDESIFTQWRSVSSWKTRTLLYTVNAMTRNGWVVNNWGAFVWFKKSALLSRTRLVETVVSDTLLEDTLLSSLVE